MGYMHIENLYKRADFLQMFRQVWVLEKIHGTSAHIKISPSDITFFKGGVDLQTRFEGLFNKDELRSKYNEKFAEQSVTFYGEAYGGKMQGMGDVYGKELKFIVFDVQYERDGKAHWMHVPNAYEITKSFGLEFVWHTQCENTLDNLNKYRDQPSEESRRLSVSENGESEGVIVRPLYECYDHFGGRYIIKHKRDKFRETASKRPTNNEVDLLKLEVLKNSEAIAEEWVTEMRLTHVMDKVNPKGPEDIPKLIEAMKEDVRRESIGEVDWTEEKSIYGQIAKRTSLLYKQHLNNLLK